MSEMSIFWCISMLNNVKSYKKSMKRLKWPTSVFLQREVSYVRSSLLKT